MERSAGQIRFLKAHNNPKVHSRGKATIQEKRSVSMPSGTFRPLTFETLAVVLVKTTIPTGC